MCLFILCYRIMGKCTFQKSWLIKADGNGYKISDWAAQKSESEVFCKLCAKTFSVSKGFEKIIQHSKGEKHTELCKISLAPSQLQLTLSQPTRFCSEPTASSSSTTISSSSTIRLYSVRDSSTTAELIWALKCISADYAFNSCVELKNTFIAMFPQLENQLDNFSLSRTKATYLITDCLAPFFHQQLVSEMEDVLFSLCYDETTNSSGKKELQTLVRFWSGNECKVVTRHLRTFFIGIATSTDILDKLYESMEHASLSSKNLIMLGSDGPNVNKKVMQLINDKMIVERKKPLIDIGTCNIHILHNAYQYALRELGDNGSELILAVFHFFKDWPSRWEDYTHVQKKMKVPLNRFIKHVPSRWLTMETAAARVLQQWIAIEEYFLRYIPASRKSLSKTHSYQKIVELLKLPAIKAELMFAKDSANMFSRFTLLFQKEEPIVHMLYEEIESLVKVLLGRICKIPPTGDVSVVNLADGNLLPFCDVFVGAEVNDELLKVREKHRLVFVKQAHHHYRTAAEHIMKKSSLLKPILKCFQCLQPNKRILDQSSLDIVTISKALPLNTNTNLLFDEWKLLQSEPDQGINDKCEVRIDSYWNYFMTLKNALGSPKYPTVSAVVKAALAVSHGNSDVERGFSTSVRILTEDRSLLSERTLNAVLVVKSALKMYDNKPHLVPVTREMLNLARCAHQKYCTYLEEEKAKKDLEAKKLEEEQRKKVEEKQHAIMLEKKKISIFQAEEKLKDLRNEEEKKRKTAERLFSEANKRLKEALKSKDIAALKEEASLAQAMIEGVMRVQEEVSDQKKQADNVQKDLDKKKSKILMTDFFGKKN